ncbi:unnamed protein product [Adineta steineri]|uniref:F-box domain-containing protein n=1 Tax=Adineta steineri TaxID=433720 RepID=A0A818PQR3_9BILA|nr:unnamed protein product [Adineta steineri]
MSAYVSNLLILPDEILLKIYKYLLNPHVLYSFYGVNKRLNTSITDYYRHIPLTDVTFEQFHHLCRAIIPKISLHIQSLSINNCRSVLQGKIFSQYFSHQISQIFPNLQKLTLVCFANDELERFLQTLNNLETLNQIEIRDVLTPHSTLFQHVVTTTNNNRFTTIKFKTSHLDIPLNPCLNILNLTITIQTIEKLSDLLLIIPNIRQLNVITDDINLCELSFDHLSPLIYLKHFTLRCYNHFWLLEEITELFKKIPFVEYLSLELSSQDSGFVNSEQRMFDNLPKPIREFHFLLRYYYDNIEDIDYDALLKSPFPIVCLIDENIEQALLHTVPYQFPLLNISSPMIKQMSTCDNYRNLDKFFDYLGMTLAEIFPIITRCRRIKEIDIQYDREDELLSVQEPQKLLTLPHLFYLKRIWLLHPSREYQSFKSILQIAPNLSELFIAFDNLLPMFSDNELCQLLGKHIIHLLILRTTAATPTIITEQYIPNLFNIFQRLRHLQIDVTNGPLIESIVLSVVNIVKQYSQLISLVVEGQSSCDELKLNARQWLVANTHLTINENFDAEYKEQTNRFLLWM